MAESLICTQFHRSPCCVQDLSYDAAGQIQVEVMKAIELTAAQYQHFASHMLEDMPFIEANSDLTGCDEKGVNHCLLVYDRKRRDGILVDCQGCDYARYAAYVPDRKQLDLRDVVVDGEIVLFRAAGSARPKIEIHLPHGRTAPSGPWLSPPPAARAQA